MITQEELQAIRERVEKLESILPGHWWRNPAGFVGWMIIAKGPKSGKPTVICDIPGVIGSEQISDFIAHSRQDIPALLAEIERLQAKISELEYDIAVMRGEINDLEGEG